MCKGVIKITKKETKDVTLKEYFDTRFNELKNYIDIKFSSIEKASCLAQENLNTRLESMNEFRDSLKDQTAQYITRAEYNLIVAKYDADIRILRESSAELRGKASQQSVNIAYAISVVSIIIGILAVYIK